MVFWAVSWYGGSFHQYLSRDISAKGFRGVVFRV